jgi:hypothetical protein
MTDNGPVYYGVMPPAYVCSLCGESVSRNGFDAEGLWHGSRATSPIPPPVRCPTCVHPEGYDRLSGPCPTCHGDGAIPPEVDSL